jgi:anhydro-N-acetylmuramic acid kinase
MRPLESLVARSQKPARIVVGLISGTSADSIDVAICRLRDREASGGVGIELIHYEEQAHDPEVRRRVLECGSLDVRGVAELHVMVGESFARAALAALRSAGLAVADVDVIGSHGQTIYHHSGVPGALRATLQVGDGDVIAVRTGCFVVSDFRARDIAAGGEGAPLSPIADGVLFGSGAWGDSSEEGRGGVLEHSDRPHRGQLQGGGSESGRRAVLNLGGIANLTVLDEDPARVFGFDTGPANAPLDRVARRISGGRLSCDLGGEIARSGRVNEELLAQLLDEDPFLKRRPPKSTGFEMYGDAFVTRAIVSHGACDADLMATLTEFVARSVVIGLEQCAELAAGVTRLVVAGGGAENPVLMERIQALAGGVSVRRSDEVGVPSDAREAMVFAVLADMALRGEPAYLPSVTGAAMPKVLGKLSFP